MTHTKPTDKQLLEQDRSIRAVNRSKQYYDMEDNRNIAGETISMYLIQQNPMYRDMLLAMFG